MRRVYKLSLPPINRGKESIGQRITRLRFEPGFPQIELAALHTARRA